MTDWTLRLKDDGDWQRFKGSVRERWGELTDDEIEEARGDLDQLVGAIKSKTGESAGLIKDVLSRLAA
ncbi:MAG TPA: CsbD family protein [Acidimicrobiia bacterium]|nr:CsbD family protein [Acidimicrobiia bacterium]